MSEGDIQRLKEIRYSERVPIVGRDVLAAEIESRFEGEFDPVLVRWEADGGWHYPVSARETACGREIPSWVLGDNLSDLFAPSSACCRECGAGDVMTNKRGVRRLIERHAGFSSTSSSPGWSKADLLALLEYVEGCRTADQPTRIVDEATGVGKTKGNVEQMEQMFSDQRKKNVSFIPPRRPPDAGGGDE